MTVSTSCDVDDWTGLWWVCLYTVWTIPKLKRTDTSKGVKVEMVPLYLVSVKNTYMNVASNLSKICRSLTKVKKFDSLCSLKRQIFDRLTTKGNKLENKLNKWLLSQLWQIEGNNIYPPSYTSLNPILSLPWGALLLVKSQRSVPRKIVYFFVLTFATVVCFDQLEVEIMF